MTELVYLAYSAALIWALLRRPQMINVTLAIAFLLAVGAAQIRDHDELRPLLTAIYAGVSVVMVALWRRYRSERATIVGWIAVSQAVWSVFAGVIGVPWNTYAIALNASCFVQIFVAGGFSDGLFAWLGRRYRRTGRRPGFSFRPVERK